VVRLERGCDRFDNTAANLGAYRVSLVTKPPTEVSIFRVSILRRSMST
jgi:hypothetical protein